MTRTEARIKNGSQVFRTAPQLTYLPAAEIITVVVVADFLKSSDIALTDSLECYHKSSRFHSQRCEKLSVQELYLGMTHQQSLCNPPLGSHCAKG